MRHSIVEMVLATDISRHFEYIVRFTKMNIVDVPDDAREGNSMTICNMLVKCADISNPTREWALCQRWAYRIVEEYFDQTREELEKGLPITMEVFDRLTCNVPLTQCGFIDMFAREAFANFAEFANLAHLSTQLESNYEQWKSLSSSWVPANNLSLHV
ncbi:cGMP-specific 3',5'-cyclic phosphodiesterase [Parelaphostrongylus tenuis]|uniref:cGMP-specific 3',5'-cyclic phosphodiesterase n=1 Tax=Parelaphostrongylus tenuis TaxID=148309 RepID=A0AAD5N995_PARTN|nr:cGMP-specific 3',5'-cyclic phosphodiesterase [Parelaphostrongylus tenuis]